MRLLAGAGFKDQGFVFAQPNGGPFHPERFTREFIHKQDQYNRANPDQALPYLRLHGLRHTWATLALQEGIDIKIVSEGLDHSSTHITSPTGLAAAGDKLLTNGSAGEGYPQPASRSDQEF